MRGAWAPSTQEGNREGDGARLQLGLTGEYRSVLQE